MSSDHYDDCGCDHKRKHERDDKFKKSFFPFHHFKFDKFDKRDKFDKFDKRDKFDKHDW